MNKLILLVALFFSTFAFALSGDAEQPIEIEAESVMVDETTGFNEFIGDAEVKQGSLVMTAEIIQVQTNADGVETMIAKGTIEKPAKYIQSQENQARFIEATATLITYDVNEGMIFLVDDAYLVQGFDSFSGDSLTYDINNDKVLVKGSEDGTKRVKFKIDLSIDLVQLDSAVEILSLTSSKVPTPFMAINLVPVAELFASVLYYFTSGSVCLW